jgi:hypothetical protein
MIAQDLEARRKALSMPYTTLGRRCGLSTNHVYGILHYGHAASFEALESIAQALGGAVRLEVSWPTTPEEMRLERARDKASREGTDADSLLRAGPTTIWLG